MPGENFPGDRHRSLVDELEGLIEEAKTPPFGKNAQMKVIDADVSFNILGEIRMSYPEEWQKSRRILKEREELMASAAAQADSIIADAQQQALTIAGEQGDRPLSTAAGRRHPRSCPSSTSARRVMLPRTTQSRSLRTWRRTSRA